MHTHIYKTIIKEKRCHELERESSGQRKGKKFHNYNFRKTSILNMYVYKCVEYISSVVNDSFQRLICKIGDLMNISNY